MLCGSCYERARFDECRQHATQARAHFGAERPYGNIVLDVDLGIAAMAQGRVREASTHYSRAWRSTRANFSSDPFLAECLDTLRIELDLDRNRQKTIEPRTLKGLSELRAVWTDIDAAAISVSAGLTLQQSGSPAVTRLLEKTRENVRGRRSESLSKCVSWLLVSHLADFGQSGRAALVWREEALPSELPELLVLDSRPWRTMESLAWARWCCRWPSPRGPARRIGYWSGCSNSSATRARRTTLGPWCVSATSAGPWLRRLLGTKPDAETRDAAESILARLEAKTPDSPVFSPRELQVLVEVRQGGRNTEIDDRLGISEPGVRFHLANIYCKHR